MEEDLSTFPKFDITLKECGKDWDQAQAEYFIKIATWHQKLVQQVEQLIENDRELKGLTPKMVLQEILGKKQE